MSEYSLALITEGQIPQAQALMHECFDEKYASIFYLYPASTLVATYQGKVVAGINLDVYQVHAHSTMGYIGWLYTDKAHRGKNLAGRLLKEAITFLKEAGCTSISACVEGDNPASFKHLEQAGFSILGLSDQLKLFRLGIVKVYHHASRFFDMGYFFWHVSLTKTTYPPSKVGLASLVPTILANIALCFCACMGWNLFALILPLWQKPTSMTVLVYPLIILLGRTISMALGARGGSKKPSLVYRGWDTAWILATILTFTIGLPFPVPGNLYLAGSDWNLEKEKKRLATMALASQGCVAFLCLFIPTGIALFFALSLLALDGLFHFYPFCGFNASRVKRLGSKAYSLYRVATLLFIAGVFMVRML